MNDQYPDLLYSLGMLPDGCKNEADVVELIKQQEAEKEEQEDK